jgi:hypothetical protein
MRNLLFAGRQTSRVERTLLSVAFDFDFDSDFQLLISILTLTEFVT